MATVFRYGSLDSSIEIGEAPERQKANIVAHKMDTLRDLQPPL